MNLQITPSGQLTVKDSTRWNEVAFFLIGNYENILRQIPRKKTTINTYIKDGKDFIEFVQDNGLNFNTLRHFRQHLELRTDIAPKTKNKKLTVARRLLQELYGHYQLLERDISRGAQNFSIEKGHVKDGINANEIEKVKVYINSIVDHKKQSRLKAMFCLLAFQGLRQFEVCELEVKDLNLYDNTARVQGKGSDDKKLINLHPLTTEAIKEYQKNFKRKDGKLFFSVSEINKTDSKKPLSTAAIRFIWNDKKSGVLAKAGVINRSVHGFRHFFVTRMLEATNGDILSVMKFSRHKSFEAVKAYDDRQHEKRLLPVYHSAF